MNEIKYFRISVWVYCMYYTGDVFARTGLRFDVPSRAEPAVQLPM